MMKLDLVVKCFCFCHALEVVVVVWLFAVALIRRLVEGCRVLELDARLSCSCLVLDCSLL